MLDFKYIYGPVQSWRMGKSLGVDPLSADSKICNLDCVYCQLGRTAHLVTERKDYVPVWAIVGEIRRFFKESDEFSGQAADIDFITFSGRGEPTLASNLGAMIRAVRRIRPEEIAVITNSTLLHLPAVQSDVSLADLVIAKLDACNERSFMEVDQAAPGISFEQTLAGIRNFRAHYKGRLAIQVMFVQENLKYARAIAELVRGIGADEIQINTPLRPSGARPLDQEGINAVKIHFAGMAALTVYERERKETVPVNVSDTVKRHGNFKVEPKAPVSWLDHP